MDGLTAAASSTASAPAKLNLRLQIKGVREDGYHLIDTDMMPITLWDRLEFRVRIDGEIRCIYEGADIAPERDLCARAAHALRARFGCSAGADILVTKRIPAGAGMGGGSSDAAATLIELNSRWGLGASFSDLAEMGTALGADVPFFLRGYPGWHPMRATGIGDVLEPAPTGAGNYFVAVPGWRLDTGAVYRRHDNLIKCRPAPQLAELAAKMGPNDLTAAAIDLSPPQFAGMVSSLLEFFGNACLTGSGSAVFSEVPPGMKGRRLEEASRLLPEGSSWFVAQGLDTRQ